MRRRRGLPVLLALFLAQASCSFAFVEPAPPRPRPATSEQTALPGVIRCSRNRRAPYFDSVLAGGSVVATIGLVAVMDALNSNDPESPFYHNEPTAEDRQTLAALLAMGIGFGISAIWGFTKTSECRDWLNPPPMRPAFTPTLR
jgi:hypothetical protein